MKEKIIDVSLAMFLTHGLREVNVQRLAKQLGISTKTFYRFFKDKEELLEQALHVYYARQFETLKESTMQQDALTLFIDIWYTATEREIRVNHIFFRDLDYYYPELKTKIETSIARKFTTQFHEIIRKAMTQGDFRNDISPEVMMQGVYVMYTATTREQRFKRFDISPYMLWLNTLVIYIRGICTASGLKKLDRHLSSLKPFSDSDRKQTTVKTSRKSKANSK